MAPLRAMLFVVSLGLLACLTSTSAQLLQGPFGVPGQLSNSPIPSDHSMHYPQPEIPQFPQGYPSLPPGIPSFQAGFPSLQPGFTPLPMFPQHFAGFQPQFPGIPPQIPAPQSSQLMGFPPGFPPQIRPGAPPLYTPMLQPQFPSGPGFPVQGTEMDNTYDTFAPMTHGSGQPQAKSPPQRNIMDCFGEIQKCVFGVLSDQARFGRRF